MIMIYKQKPRPLCSECKIHPSRSNGKSSRGFDLWHKLCGGCAKRKYTRKMVEAKGNTCEDCGFVGDPCQLDVVNILDKHRTICANCNRLRIKNNNTLKRQRQEFTVDSTILDLDYRL
jgi:hypothetical protein